MKKLSAILVIVLVLIMTVATVSASDIGYKLTASKAAVEAGETFTIEVSYTPTTLGLFAADVLIGYDTSLVEYIDATSAVTGQSFTKKNAFPEVGYLTLTAGTDWSVAYENGEFSTVTFKALEDVSGSAVFTVDLTATGSIYGNDYVQRDTLASKEGTTVTIGDTTPEPPVTKKFDVSAVDDNTNTVVKVKDCSELPAGTVGTIYVATYENDVLVKCESKPLVDGEWTFTGYTGNVKVFVWDANNVPLVDEVIEL